MADLKPIFLDSTDAAGRTWRIGYYKPDRSPGVVSAYEGRLNQQDGWHSFTCDLFGCRKFQQPLPGRATKRAIAQALRSLLLEMKAAAVIPADAADSLISKAEAV